MAPLDIADLSRYAARTCHGHLVTGICRPCFEWWAEAPRDHRALAEVIRAELTCICEGKPERHGTVESRYACPFVVADELEAEVDRLGDDDAVTPFSPIAVRVPAETESP